MAGDHERDRFVEDLLSYMTLEEKLGQIDLFRRPDDPGLERAIVEGRVGGIVGENLSPRFQTLATERSRLGIPLLLIAGTADITMSPWALAASWDEGLAFTMGGATAQDAIRHGFNAMRAPLAAGDGAAPALPASQIATSEPHLAARLAAAFAKGALGGSADYRNAVLAVSGWTSSSDADGVDWSRSLIHAGGVSAIDCGALDRDTAMRAGFAGILVAECQGISDVITRHFRATSARSELEAAERLIAEGSLSDQDLDGAVRGVLAAKHALGLFRDPQRILAPLDASSIHGTADQRVRGTFVLLRNEAGLLPLSPVSDRVLVVGGADGIGAACADALGRAGIGHSNAPGLAQRRPGESWTAAVAGDHFALSLTCDAARRADFVIVALGDHHFVECDSGGWRQPAPTVLTMLRGLVLGGARLVAVLATTEPVDLGDADQHFAAVLQCWQPRPGFEEALCDILSARFSPQGRMPVSAGRFLTGHGLGFGESVLSRYTLTTARNHILASVQVRNSGSFAMRETVQAYLRVKDGRLRLVAFRHVMLAPGQTEIVHLELGPDALACANAGGRTDVAPGHYEILVGKSSGRLLAESVDISPALARAIMLKDTGYIQLAAG